LFFQKYQIWYILDVPYHGTVLKINFNLMKTEKEVRKLTKTGRGSMYVVLPKKFITDLGWRERQKLVVERVRGGIMIRDWRR